MVIALFIVRRTSPIDTVLRWSVQTFAESQQNLISVEVASVDHVINSHFREAVET